VSHSEFGGTHPEQLAYYLTMSHVKWPIIREWVMSSNLLSENGSCHTWSWRDTLHTGSLLFQNESCQVEYHLKTSHGKKSVELAQVVYYS